MARPILVTIDGIEDSIRGHARRLGISESTVAARRKRGLSPEAALEKKQPMLFDVGGVMLTSKEAAARAGVSPDAIRRRAAHGKDLAAPRPAPRRIEHPTTGEPLTVREIAEREGVHRQTIYQRLERAEREKTEGKKTLGRRPTPTTLDEIEATVREHAERLGISKGRVRDRIRRESGSSSRVDEQHAGRPGRPRAEVTLDNISATVSEHAARLRTSVARVRHRIAWEVEGRSDG
jgi:transcriptional regulator with XRE-family HTH domain